MNKITVTLETTDDDKLSSDCAITVSTPYEDGAKSTALGSAIAWSILGQKPFIAPTKKIVEEIMEILCEFGDLPEYKIEWNES